MNGAYQMSVRCLSCPPEQGRLVHQAVGVPTMGRTETCATAVCVACVDCHVGPVEHSGGAPGTGDLIVTAPTVTDLFCGAGGSSLGAEYAGAQLVMAANHWQTAIDVHQVAFPDAGHDVADISQADPRRYPVTDILIASPECTNHSQARGISRKRQDPELWDAPDPSRSGRCGQHGGRRWNCSATRAGCCR